jgi:Xaa-Pro dipeptidase
MSLNELLDLVEHAKPRQLPAPPRDPQGLEFATSEYGRRHAAASALMRNAGLDAMVLAGPHAVRYFSGLQTWLWILPPLLPTLVILTPDPEQTTLVSTGLERGGVEATTWIPEPIYYEGSGDAVASVVAALARRGIDGGRIGFELGLGQRPNLSPNDQQRLVAVLPRAEIVDVAQELWAIRAIKSEGEVAKLREATRIAQVGFRAAFDALVPGVTEAELTRIAARAMLDAGALPAVTPITLIFLAGPDRYRQLVQPAGHRPIEAGELVWLDGGCSVDGYRADFIRSGVIGELPSKSEGYYEVALEALEAGVRALRPGRALGEAYAAAQQVFDQAGVGAFNATPDLIGHSVGLDHWELPLIGRPGTDQGDVICREGMVLCVEPTIAGMDGDQDWRAGLFVAEDQVLVTGEGVEVLTSDLSRELARR